MIAEPVVDWGALLEVVWTSIVGGVGVTAVFAVAILGGVRVMDARVGGRGASSVAYGALTVLAAAVVIASVVFAITIIKTK